MRSIGIPFQTRARTVDHLGREQIADTPTAISELWKNSFDAYARSVELNIYDSLPVVASLLDDGHGMNVDEFASRWLVVGTESKAGREETSFSDRNGLLVRLRQGQKGIGRLSCANLGPLLLLVSKRSGAPFVVALIDWRLFENPYLNLADINIPVTETEHAVGAFSSLPSLTSILTENLGAPGDERGQRNTQAWELYDAQKKREAEEDGQVLAISPSSAIREAAADLPFRPEHLARWPAFEGTADHGTALIVGNANYDLQAQLSGAPGDSTAVATRTKLFETLSSFVDPFIDPLAPERNAVDPQFEYAVRTWRDGTSTLVLGTEKQFSRSMVDGMEHRIEGTIDRQGVFRGRIRAFGKDIDSVATIEPPKDLRLSTRAEGEVGPLDVVIASMEFERRSSSHTDAEFTFYKDLAKSYAAS